jgi:hypothetical protein
MIAGCYSVDLYCDNADPASEGRRGVCKGPAYKPNPDAYTGETEGECLRQARRDGWTFTRTRPRFAYCPACSNKGTP